MLREKRRNKITIRLLMVKSYLPSCRLIGKHIGTGCSYWLERWYLQLTELHIRSTTWPGLDETQKPGRQNDSPELHIVMSLNPAVVRCKSLQEKKARLWKSSEERGQSWSSEEGPPLPPLGWPSTPDSRRASVVAVAEFYRLQKSYRERRMGIICRLTSL
jgi:hypothetical protein